MPEASIASCFSKVILSAATKAHRAVIETRGFKTTLVAVPDPSVAPSVAAALLAEGVQLLELCGAFGPHWTNRVLEATEHRVPVGAVSYGVESVAALTALVSTAPTPT